MFQLPFELQYLSLCIQECVNASVFHSMPCSFQESVRGLHMLLAVQSDVAATMHVM